MAINVTSRGRIFYNPKQRMASAMRILMKPTI